MMIIQKSETKKGLPRSCSNYRINLLCLSLFFVAMFFLYHCFPQMRTVRLTMLCLLATTIPLWLYDFLYLKVNKLPSTGLLDQPRIVNTKRVTIKLIGLWGTFLIILGFYQIIPFFRKPFYAPFFDYLNLFGPWVILLSIIYFFQIDRRQRDPYDGYWHMGCLLTGRFKKVNAVIIKEHLRIWFIKAFFTPIMLGIMVNNVDSLLSFNWHGWPWAFLSTYKIFLTLFYTIDVIYAFLGYVLTFRLLDTHIRSTEPTVLGWLVCLACYYPFSTYFGIARFNFEDGFLWNHWFAFFPVYYYFYAFVILFLTLVYALATVAFGQRMSNQTFRGIITSGPYRFTKHPAYICKVSSWWLISLPFFSAEGPLVAIKHTLCLVVITVIYYIRARTEENHLSNYPEYVRYAEWMNEHGALSFITKYFPVLQYSEKKCKRWKSVVWFKKL